MIFHDSHWDTEFTRSEYTQRRWHFFTLSQVQILLYMKRRMIRPFPEFQQNTEVHWHFSYKQKNREAKNMQGSSYIYSFPISCQKDLQETVYTLKRPLQAPIFLCLIIWHEFDRVVYNLTDSNFWCQKFDLSHFSIYFWAWAQIICVCERYLCEKVAALCSLLRYKHGPNKARKEVSTWL